MKVLVARLVGVIKNNFAVLTTAEMEKHDTYLSCLPPTVHWMPLTKSATPFPEPNNPDRNLQARTELNGGEPNEKYSFVLL